MTSSERHSGKVLLGHKDQGTKWGHEEAGEASTGHSQVKLRPHTFPVGDEEPVTGCKQGRDRIREAFWRACTCLDMPRISSSSSKIPN